jgi:hypothetical protein
MVGAADAQRVLGNVLASAWGPMCNLGQTDQGEPLGRSCKARVIAVALAAARDLHHRAG